MEASRQSFYAKPEHAGNFVEMQAEEVFDLRAGDQHGDAVGESNYDWAWDELHCRSESSQSHDDQEQSGHYGAHEQPIHAVHCNDARYDDDEGSGWPANLHL